ncbi:cdkn1a interacting zinc finger protein 1b [Girardinichthys multiradiatus]|uniref:cdkn1a interacting zinc finger protein 1b n=1 Tax=Girardinichthys multiradiatus TaxID=208333 RepID=UPI001FAE280D|nr:cdkn1a interacting zinc finger protein 1b [Girardinichthys multiradiatus]
MVRQTRRTDRCFLPAAGGGVAKVRFPVSPGQRVLLPAQQALGSSDIRPHCRSSTAGVARGTDGRSQAGGPGPNGGSGESQLKRSRENGNEASAALHSRTKAPRSCDPAGDGSGSDPQGAAEQSRAIQLQSVGSLKVTIQQSSDSREFGQTDRHTAALHCHVCNLTCRSLQVFQEHLSGRDHLSKLQDITQSIQLNVCPLLDRGRHPQTRRWCDTCQNHFTGDIIIHRRTKQHKVSKRQGRPFCPVCQRHFRTPRKFVEHIKSADHKQQVQLEEGQEEELITVDALGCFEEEEEEEEDVEVVDENEDTEQSEVVLSEPVNPKEPEEESDPQLTYGSSFVVPVHGFVCRLCSKFFYRETAARHTHCRTPTHYLNLQCHISDYEAANYQSQLVSRCVTEHSSRSPPTVTWVMLPGHPEAPARRLCWRICYCIKS